MSVKTRQSSQLSRYRAQFPYKVTYEVQKHCRRGMLMQHCRCAGLSYLRCHVLTVLHLAS